MENNLVIDVKSGVWDRQEKEGISQKIMGRVKPDEPLKNKIDVAQKRLQFQISKLEVIDEKLKKKHDVIFEKIVNAQKNHRPQYAKAYAGELTQVRKMKNMVSGAKLSMEQIKIRLDTVSELGDVVVTLSPCMSIIKGLSPSLNGIMPEATSSMQDLSQILGDVMSNSSMNMGDTMQVGADTNVETMAILEEAHTVIAGQTRESIPEVPAGLRSPFLASEQTSAPAATVDKMPNIKQQTRASVLEVPAGQSASNADVVATGASLASITDIDKASNIKQQTRASVLEVPAGQSASNADVVATGASLASITDIDKASNIKQQTRISVPDVPSSLKHQIVQKRLDVMI